MLVVDASPLGAAGDPLLAAVIEGALGEATGRALSALGIARDGVRARFLIAGSSAVTKAKAWLEQGVSWGEALTRLHGQESSPRGAA